MSKIKARFIQYGEIDPVDDVNSRQIPANYAPVNYVPQQASAEGVNKISAHLRGIDNALASLVTTNPQIDGGTPSSTYAVFQTVIGGSP